MTDDDAMKEYIDYLIEEGGITLEGITDDGEPIYRHNMEILEVIAPEYAKIHMREIEDALLSLYEKGLVEIEITDAGEVYYKAVEGIKPILDYGD
jgi:hypothetical protein